MTSPEWEAANEDDSDRTRSTFDRADNTARLALDLAAAKRSQAVADEEHASLVAEVERLRETSEHRAELLKDALRERDQWHDAAYNWAYFNQRRAEAAEAKVAKVEALHVVAVNPTDWASDWCEACGRVWPCPTAAALADAPAAVTSPRLSSRRYCRSCVRPMVECARYCPWCGTAEAGSIVASSADAPAEQRAEGGA